MHRTNLLKSKLIENGKVSKFGLAKEKRIKKSKNKKKKNLEIERDKNKPLCPHQHFSWHISGGGGLSDQLSHQIWQIYVHVRGEGGSVRI